MQKQNDQRYSDPTTRTQATIVWFPEDTCTTFQVEKIHMRMIKIQQRFFIESIPYEDVSPEKIRQSNYKIRNFNDMANELTRFQSYTETEFYVNTTNHFIKRNFQKLLSKRARLIQEN